MLRTQFHLMATVNVLHLTSTSIMRQVGRSRVTKMRLNTTESFLSPQDIPPLRIVTADIEDAGTTLTKKANLSTPLQNPESTIVTFRIPELKFGPNLLRYSVNLNKLAEEGKLDEVVGRDKEIMMAMQVLSRRRKNNPCLVGEAGVGKTAIAEGIAMLIQRKNAPAPLLDKVVVSLDVAGIVAGCKFRGEFEERMKNLLSEVDRLGDRLILFIDELHTIVGAGGGGGGEGSSMDAANILKPALARGTLRCMGATTLDEFRSCIEKDPALARRFQAVTVDEPSEAVTLCILRALRPKYEAFHKVRFDDDALQASVRLANRFLPSRRFPDKAIDLLDDAAARLKLDRPHISNSNPNSKPDLSSEASELLVGEQNIAQVVSTTTGIPLSVLQKHGATTSGAGETELLELEQKLGRAVIGQKLAVSAVCNALRVAKAGLGRVDRPLGVFLLLGGSGVGKTELAKRVSQQLFPIGGGGRSGLSGLESESVDVAEERGAMLRIDMSEYASGFSVSRLIGSPPGYVGFNDRSGSGGGGLLTEAVRTRPYQVVLLDEFEKAHSDVTNLFLQVFDEGRLTDSHGRLVDFRNTLILMTSNLGAEVIEDYFRQQGQQSGAIAVEESERRARLLGQQLARSQFPAELVGRLDEVLVFKPLAEEDLQKICALQLEKVVVTPLSAQRGVIATLSPDLPAVIVRLSLQERAADETVGLGLGSASRLELGQGSYGARSLWQSIQRMLLRPCARFLLEDRLRSGDSLFISSKEYDGSELLEMLELFTDDGTDNKIRFFVRPAQ